MLMDVDHYFSCSSQSQRPETVAARSDVKTFANDQRKLRLMMASCFIAEQKPFVLNFTAVRSVFMG